MITPVTDTESALENQSQQAPPPLEAGWSFEDEKRETDSLVGEMQGEKGEWRKCENRKSERIKEVVVQDERNAKRIGPTDTIIPIRRIHSAIMLTKPQMSQYLSSSNRILIFNDAAKPAEQATPLEVTYSKWMRYEGWIDPWEQLIDGVLLDGGGFIEVQFDSTKPLFSTVEFVPRSEIAFPAECKNIQQTERIVRVFKFLPYQLKKFIDQYGWDKTEVQRLYDANEKNRNQFFNIYRVWRKYEGQVFVYWMAENGERFLSPPQPLEVVPGQPTIQYPIFFCPLEIQADAKITDIKGFAYRMLPSQEAETELWTNIVNASKKASRVYASTDASGMNATLAETIPLSADAIVQQKTNYWAYPWPPLDGLAFVQSIATTFTADLGQVNYAVAQRKDKTQKTATEIQSAEQISMAASSVFVKPFSQTVLGVYVLRYQIAKVVILMGKVPDWPQELIEPLNRRYFFLPAGDVDFIERNRKLGVLQSLMQLTANTGLAPIILKLYIRYALPEEAAEVFQTAEDKQLILALAQALLTMAQGVQLPPDQSAQIAQLLQQAQQSAGPLPPQPTPGVEEGSGDSNLPSQSGDQMQ